MKKGFLYVFFANLINLIIGIVTGFVLPKYLSIESYSNIKLFQLYISYVGILHLGFADGMYLQYGGKKLDELDSKEIISEYKTFNLFQGGIVLLAIIISLILKNYVLLFCSFSIIPVNVSNYLKNLYQAIGKYEKYAKYTNMNTLFLFFVNLFLLFIIKTDNNWMYIICYVIAYLIYWIFLEIEFRRLFHYKRTKSNIKYLINDIKNGFFLMIGNFCSILFTSIDRLFVKYLLGIIQFAYYSFAVSVENLINVFTTPLSVVMYNYFCINQSKEKIMFAKKILLVFSSCVIASAFLIKFVVNYWIPKYNHSINVLFLLFTAQYFTILIRCIYNNLYKTSKKQNKYFGIMVTIVIISITLNIIVYNIHKSIEAFAIATMITSIIWFIICEFDFKQNAFSVYEYLYIILTSVAYLFLGVCFNSIVGFLIYIMVVAILTAIFMRDVIKYMIENMKEFKKKISRSRKENGSK